MGSVQAKPASVSLKISVVEKHQGMAEVEKVAGRLRRWNWRGQTVLIAVTEKDLTVLNL